MTSPEPRRSAARRGRPSLLAAVVLAAGVLFAVVGHPSLAASSSVAGTAADGVLPDGVTVLDEEYAGVRNLDPALLDALHDAAADAARDGVRLSVNSGWRSRAHQERLLDQAIATYGSRAEAARWVATPDTSPHVSGDAVDLGRGAAAWLSEHGWHYGLCRIYDNEPWHFELRPDAVDDHCPSSYADPSHDPRMRS